MICEFCGEDSTRKSFGYVAHSPLVGDIFLENIEVTRCDECNETSVDYKSAGLIDKLVKEAEDFAIGRLPIGDFVVAKLAYQILDISKQAFAKDERIKQGFIIQRALDKDSKKLYYVPSVKRYKITRDGRIRLGESVDGMVREYEVLEKATQRIRAEAPGDNVLQYAEYQKEDKHHVN